MEAQEFAETIPHGDPIALFDAWFTEARVSEPNDANAMALATATPGGLPSVRMVLLKGHGPEGFVFYTNSHSRKGQEILANPNAALLFHWKSLRRQIRLEGPLTPVDAATADAYFASRARDSQLGAVASDQSASLEPVDPVGHGAAGDQGLLHQLARGEAVGLAGAPQGREDVELPALERVPGKGLGAVEVEAAGQARDA